MSFDKTKPYDEVWGDDDKGRRYFQDGKYFNAAGDEVPDDNAKASKGK